MKVALFGATGFVGGYLVRALLAAGHEPSVLVRPGSEKKLQAADRCRVTSGDISSRDAIETTLQGCDAAIYNIGLLKEFRRKGITFEEAHFDGVQRVAEKAERLGVKRFLLMSANGVKAHGTPYQETKYRAEELVRRSRLDWTIFQPSVIFGDSSGTQEISHQLHVDIVKPPVPAPGFRSGWSKQGNSVVMSPVSVTDVADAFVGALSNDDTIERTIVLGGPEILTWEDMILRVAEAAGQQKTILPVHIGLMKFAARLFDWIPMFPATKDQLTMLAEGNAAKSGELEAITGRSPKTFTSENMTYLRKSNSR
jgi:NADH dehydrogenase